MKEENIIIQGAVGKLKGIITTPIHCKEKETPRLDIHKVELFPYYLVQNLVRKI